MIKEFIKKHKAISVLIAVVFFGIVIPFLIDKSYDWTNKKFFTNWDAADALSYYGTLLGATATITAVTWTIFETRNSSKTDWDNQMILSNRSHIVKYATEFIDAIDYQNLVFEFVQIGSKIENSISQEKANFQELETFGSWLMSIANNSNSAFSKYQIFETEENANVFLQLDIRQKEYYKGIVDFVILIENSADKMLEISETNSGREFRKKCMAELKNLPQNMKLNIKRLLSWLEILFPK